MDIVEWDGRERRTDFCSEGILSSLMKQIDDLNNRLDKTLPRWAFVSALSSLIAISIIFAGWHVNSLGTMSHELKSLVKDLEVQHDTDFLRLSSQYHRDVEKFYYVAEKNKEILIKVQATQENVLKELEKITKRNTYYDFNFDNLKNRVKKQD